MRLFPRLICFTVLFLLPLGCGYRSELNRKVISGRVTCGGENVPRGVVRFVPTGATHGPATSARIRNGQYRAENRGGVPYGTHRVEVFAQRPTGEKRETMPGEFVEILEDFGDKQYAGKDSPLTADVTPDSPDTMDFEIP